MRLRLECVAAAVFRDEVVLIDGNLAVDDAARRQAVEEVVGLVPDVWLATDGAQGSVAETRRAYVDFLAARLRGRDAWLPEPPA